MEFPDERHFNNPWISESITALADKEAWANQITSKLSALTKILSAESASLSSSDISMYTGLAGIGLFYYRLSQARLQLPDASEHQSGALCQAQHLRRRCLRHVDLQRLKKNASVFTSSIGALLLGAIVPCSQSDGQELTPDRCFEEIMAASDFVTSSDNEIPDEALYGRTGYLCALLILESAGFSIDSSLFTQVVEAIIKSGLRTAKRYQNDGLYAELMQRSSHSKLPMPPLMFEWHGKAYLGGAHGFAGILLTLLKVHHRHPEVFSPKAVQDLIMPTVRWMGELQLNSGNWPSSLGNSVDRDVLVHWCHGATGVVPLMLAAYELTQDEYYLKRAVKGGDTIWARGLLFKGCGLCHGSAGSGYALLDLYRLTNDEKHLWRAQKFAEWCTDCVKNRTRVADRPYSLFEGLAGTLYFLVEILDPSTARFPLLNGL